MARDQVTIANLATGFFGEDDQIRSLDEDSKPARTVRAVWDELRRFVLSKGEWDFATRTLELSPRPAHVDWPVYGYRYAFKLPSSMRRFIAVLEPDFIVQSAYRIQAGRQGPEILADSAALTVRFVDDVTECAYWSDGFVEAFAMRLAWQIADRLSGDKQRKQQALDAYETALRRAKGVDAKQNPPRRQTEGEWTRARRGGRLDPSTGWH